MHIRHYTHRLILISALCAGGSSFADTASNSSAGDALQEIVVTATRQEQPLSKVPISVAAYTAETMDKQGVRSIEDIARLTPGLNFSASTFGSSTSTDITIRGIKSSSGAATTGVYIDDVPIQIRANVQTAFGADFPQVFDLERIEVLRGPQGTLFGAGAEGGAVRFITPTPSLTESSSYSRVEMSSTQNGGLSYEAGTAGGAPIIDNVLGFRASAWYRADGGYVDRQPFNTSTPDTQRLNDVNNSDTSAFKLALRYQPVDGLQISPSIYYQRQHLSDSGGFWGTLSNPSSDQLTSGYVIAQPATDEFTLPSLNIEWSLGPAALTSVTSYYDRKASAIEDYTQQDASFLTYILHNNIDPTVPETFTAFLPGQNAPGVINARQENLSEELRLTSTDSGARVRWTVGAFFSRDLQDESFQITDQYAPQFFPVAPVFGEPLTDGRYIFLAYNHSLDKQLAAFAQADVKLIDPLSVTLGLRYSKIDDSFSRTTAGPLNYIPPGPDFQTNAGTQTARPLTPKFGLNLQADDNNLFYLSIAEGFRAGGVNPPLFVGCTNLPVPLTYGPDSTWSYEVGSKNKFWGGALRMEESVYYIKWNNIQQFVSPGGACAGNGFRDNLGQAESKGFDYQATVKLSDHLTFTGAAGYDRANYTKTIIVDGTLFARNGDTLGVTPWQLSGVAEYTHALLDGEGYALVQDQYGSRDNGRLATRDDPRAAGYDPTITPDPAVNQLDFRFGFRKAGLDASFFVDNALNRLPELSKEHDVTDPADTLYYYHTLRPRTIGVTATYRYR